MSVTQIALARVPSRWRPLMVRHRELIKFTLVGGTCFVLTMVVNYALRLTVLAEKPVTALTVATFVATLVSYVLNKQWSFRSSGSHRREMFLFFVVSGLAIVVNDIPLYLAHYAFDLRKPHITGVPLEISDFVNGLIVGTLLAMVFRWWAMRRFVFTKRRSAQAAAAPAPRRHPSGV